MKKLLATSAMIMAFASPLLAQDTPTGPYLANIDGSVSASQFIGKRVYVTEADTTAYTGKSLNAAEADWQDAGEISDVLLSLTGDTEAVLVDFGGFLGIGEKTVAVDMKQLTLVPNSDSPGNYFIVFNGSKATLEAAPAYTAADAAMAEPQASSEATETAPAAEATEQPDAGTTGMAPAAGTADAPAADTAATETAPAPADAATAPATVTPDMLDLSGYTADKLMGMRVYDQTDADIGEISGVQPETGGPVTSVLVDVGGFLGIGEKRVALDANMLSFAPNADNSSVMLKVNATKEQLEALPEIKG